VNVNKNKVETSIKLKVPREVHVELVPLTVINKVEFLFFWSSFFLSIFCVLFGCIMSLTLSNYANQAVLKILAVFCIIFFGFFIVFAVIGFRIRRKIREETMAEEADNNRRVYLKAVEACIDFLPEEFTKSDFIKAYMNMAHETNDTMANKMFNVLQKSNLVKEKKLGKDRIVFKKT